MVTPTLSCDVRKLEDKFARGYCNGVVVFHVSTINEARETLEFTEAEMHTWGALWKEKNNVFMEYIDSKLELKFFKNLKFFVCNGNHRRLAWMNLIDREYPLVLRWHYVVNYIVLDTKGRIEIVM